MGSLFGDYALGAAWDEMFAADGRAARAVRRGAVGS